MKIGEYDVWLFNISCSGVEKNELIRDNQNQDNLESKASKERKLWSEGRIHGWDTCPCIQPCIYMEWKILIRPIHGWNTHPCIQPCMKNKIHTVTTHGRVLEARLGVKSKRDTWFIYTPVYCNHVSLEEKISTNRF